MGITQQGLAHGYAQMCPGGHTSELAMKVVVPDLAMGHFNREPLGGLRVLNMFCEIEPV